MTTDSAALRQPRTPYPQTKAGTTMLHRRHPVIDGDFAREQHDIMAAEIVAIEDEAGDERDRLREALTRCVNSLADHVSYPNNGWMQERGEAIVQAHTALAQSEEARP